MARSEVRRPARVVVLGGGYGGAYCARALERKHRRREAGITVIDRQNYFVIYPLLVEAGTGSVEPRHAVVSIRSFLRRGEFRMAEVTGIDSAAGEVVCRLPGGEGEQRIGFANLV